MSFSAQTKLLALCQAFHGYLMKYLVMICRGHVPIHGVGARRGAINKDSENFIKMFLSKGVTVTQDSYLQVVRQFHLAFKGKDAAEVYDVLIEQLLRAIRKYDPEYKKKLKQIVEMLDEKFAQRKFTVAAVNRHLEFDAVGYLRLLVRYQYLESVGKGEFEHTGSWPPPAQFFAGQPIGITYCVQTWFQYYLQQWISSSMGQLESKEGVYSLDCRGEYGSGSSQPSSGNSDLAIPASSSRRARTEGRTRYFLRRRAEGFEIGRGRLRDRIEFRQ